MASATKRGFPEVVVKRLGSQRGRERFRLHRRAPSPDGLNFRVPGEPDDEEGEAPRVREFVMNVTALSQVHNLYFAAYCDKVHVFVPRQQIFTSEPVLILDLPSTIKAIHPVSAQPGCNADVNHLIVGNLGEAEILLLAIDGCYVIAYYTSDINRSIQTRSKDAVKPFLVERVSKSAWGLAIHSQSRLIAVGTNAHRAEVFAPALCKGSGNAFQYRHSDETYKPRKYFYCSSAQEIPRNSDGHMNRDTDWTFSVSLDRSLIHNIPSLAFSSDRMGNANALVLKDVKGGLWFHALWFDAWKRIPTESWNDATLFGFRPLGWGVLVLPENFFKTTDTVFETYGGPYQWLGQKPRAGVDISESARHLDDCNDDVGSFRPFFAMNTDCLNNNAMHQKLYLSKHHWHEEVGRSLDNEEQATPGSFSTYSYISSQDWSLKYVQLNNLLNLDVPDCALEDPELGFSIVKDRNSRTRAVSSRSVADFITDGSFIIHTGRNNICLLASSISTLNPSNASLSTPETEAINVLSQVHPHAGPFPLDRMPEDYDRLNMLAAIPELSLVIVASQVGKVALITVTRPRIESENSSLQQQTKVKRARPDITLAHSEGEPRISIPALELLELLSDDTLPRWQRSQLAVWCLADDDGMSLEIQQENASKQSANMSRSSLLQQGLRELLIHEFRIEYLDEHRSNLNKAKDIEAVEDREHTRRVEKEMEAGDRVPRKKLSCTPTFRIDRILPTAVEENAESEGGLELRPACGLLGIAISPVWRGEGKRNDKRRWRLMLHYYDHTIIGYELDRGEFERLGISPVTVISYD